MSKFRWLLLLPVRHLYVTSWIALPALDIRIMFVIGDSKHWKENFPAEYFPLSCRRGRAFGRTEKILSQKLKESSMLRRNMLFIVMLFNRGGVIFLWGWNTVMMLYLNLCKCSLEFQPNFTFVTASKKCLNTWMLNRSYTACITIQFKAMYSRQSRGSTSTASDCMYCMLGGV